MIKRLKSNWVVSTLRERVRFVAVMFFMLVFGGVAMYLLVSATQGELEMSDSMRKMLLSYLAFIVMMVLSYVSLRPKGVKG